MTVATGNPQNPEAVTVYYVFEEVGISDRQGCQGGSFDGRVEVVVLAPASTERYPVGERTVSVPYRATFALGTVEIEYRLLDKATQRWRRELRVPPESIQYEIRMTLYCLHYDEIEELVDHHPDAQRDVA